MERIKTVFLSATWKGQSVRYALCGGANVALNWFLYFITYNFIVEKKNISIFDSFTISPHIFAFLSAFLITFFNGFLLNYYFVFRVKGNIEQHLIKYSLSNIGSVLINYILLKLFVETFHWYPTPSQMFTTCIVTLYSFAAQKFLSFRKK